MDATQFKQLLDKYESGTCSPEEFMLLESWYLSEAKKQSSFKEYNLLPDFKSLIWQDITERTGVRYKPNPVNDKPNSVYKTKRLWSSRFIGIAAAILLVVLGGLAVIMNLVQDPNANDSGVILISKHNDIKPGSNKAYLTLANGKVINLSVAKAGVVIDAGKLTYNDGTEINTLFKNSRHPDAGQDPALAMNTRLVTTSTPPGGQYQVVLSDGTHIYLNAASSIKFPTTFTGLKERKVELTGEAYFVVKHDAKQPFRVQTAGQVVEDIGTTFNINAYSDEALIKTTLIEGSAKVITPKESKGVLRHPSSSSGQYDMGQAQHYNGTILKPGQQSELTHNGDIKVNQVNTKEVMAWKNGYFRFNNDDIESVMRKLSRWYDIDVKYEGPVSKEEFSGAISKYKDISQALKMLAYSKSVRFKIEGRRITVMQ